MSIALSDRQTVAGYLAPASVSAGNASLSAYVDMSKFERVQFIIPVGALGASATLDGVVKQATDSSGTSAKNLTSSKAITQLTQAGSGSNKVVVVNVSSADLDVNNGFKFVNLVLTVGTAASVVGLLCLGDSEATPPTTSNGSISTLAQVIQ